ncbi:MAG: hypothetical protein JHC33_11675 [Ignisphaera sp.]|nr:hypothetical protein [Ignisphaera sp.]
MVVRLRAPPRIKVLEALGSIADGRVKVLNEKCANVVSSEGDRVYTVYVDLDEKVVFSDDNGTKFRGYIGYPIIAFLMIKGVLPFDEKLAKALMGIPWRKLNEEYKSYSIVEKIVKDIAKQRGVDATVLDSFVSNVMNKLGKLSLTYDENKKCAEL